MKFSNLNSNYTAQLTAISNEKTLKLYIAILLAVLYAYNNVGGL